jgi:hypothetical protein
MIPLHLIAPLAAILLGGAPAPTGAIRLSFLHNLSTLTGDVRLGGLGLSYDRTSKELFVFGYGAIRVFNAAGMETYSFGDDEAFGSVLGVVALEGGDLLVLSYREGIPSIIRTNFRGEPQGKVELSGLPPDLAPFKPNVLAYVRGTVYFADLATMRVLLTDADGSYRASFDVAALLDLETKREDTGLNGFAVDQDGNLLFTIAPMFRAYVVSPDGEVRSFGKSGSAPGLFNIVAGIGSDDAGRIYVVDSLKCAVIVFDRDFNFVGEFGYRGSRPGNLIAPRDVAVAKDAVYVAQGGRRGVTAYQIVP